MTPLDDLLTIKISHPYEAEKPPTRIAATASMDIESASWSISKKRTDVSATSETEFAEPAKSSTPAIQEPQGRGEVVTSPRVKNLDEHDTTSQNDELGGQTIIGHEIDNSSADSTPAATPPNKKQQEEPTTALPIGASQGAGRGDDNNNVATFTGEPYNLSKIKTDLARNSESEPRNKDSSDFATENDVSAPLPMTGPLHIDRENPSVSDATSGPPNNTNDSGVAPPLLSRASGKSSTDTPGSSFVSGSDDGHAEETPAKTAAPQDAINDSGNCGRHGHRGVEPGVLAEGERQGETHEPSSKSLKIIALKPPSKEEEKEDVVKIKSTLLPTSGSNAAAADPSPATSVDNSNSCSEPVVPSSAASVVAIPSIDEMGWSMEHHRSFVAAVFEIGLKHCSPSVIMDSMKNLPSNITREKTKSHLQKFRKISDRSQAEFMAEYDSFLRHVEATAAAQASDKKDRDDDGKAVARSNEDSAEPKVGDINAEEAAAVLKAAIGDTAPDQLIGGKAVAYTSYSIANDCPIPESSNKISYESKPEDFPVLTDEETASSLGQSLLKVKGAFEFVTEFILKARHGIPMKLNKRIPPFLKEEDLATVVPCFPSSNNDAQNTGGTHGRTQEHQTDPVTQSAAGNMMVQAPFQGFPLPTSMVPGYPPFPLVGYDQGFPAGAPPMFPGGYVGAGSMPPSFVAGTEPFAGHNAMVAGYAMFPPPLSANPTMYAPTFLPPVQFSPYPHYPPPVPVGPEGPYPQQIHGHGPYFMPFQPLPPHAQESEGIPYQSGQVPDYHGGVAGPHSQYGYGHHPPPPPFGDPQQHEGMQHAGPSHHPSYPPPEVPSAKSKAPNVPQSRSPKRQESTSSQQKRELMRNDSEESPPHGLHLRNIFDSPSNNKEGAVSSKKASKDEAPSGHPSRMWKQQRKMPQDLNIFASASPISRRRTTSASGQKRSWSPPPPTSPAENRHGKSSKRPRGGEMTLSRPAGRASGGEHQQQDSTDRPGSSLSFNMSDLGLHSNDATPTSENGVSPVSLVLRDIVWAPLAIDSKDHDQHRPSSRSPRRLRLASSPPRPPRSEEDNGRRQG